MLKGFEKAGKTPPGGFPDDWVEYNRLEEDDEELWHLFQDLSIRRPIGMSGPMGIPWTEIRAMLELRGYPKSMRSINAEALSFLDAHWLSHFWKNQEKKGK